MIKQFLLDWGLGLLVIGAQQQTDFIHVYIYIYLYVFSCEF